MRHTRPFLVNRLSAYLASARGESKDLALEIAAALGDRALRCHWSSWVLNPHALRVIRHTLEDAVTLRKLLADDHAWLDDQIAAEAKRGGWRGIWDFDQFTRPERQRAAALCWLRGYSLGSCAICNEFLGGCVSLGICSDCKYGGEPVATNVETAKICQLSGESLV